MTYARIKIFILLLICSQTGFSQNASVEHQFEYLQGQIPMTWVTQRFLVHKQLDRISVAGGLETQSAVFGDYGGFYVFGLHGRLVSGFGPWNVHSGVSMATGGGAGAPDGDGLMYRFEAGLGRSLTSRSRLGITYSILDFPTGDIASKHAALNFSYQLPYQWQSTSNSIKIFPGAVSVIGGFFLFDAADASRITDTGKSLYTGVRFTQQIRNTLELDLQLGASAVGSTDGFMDYKAGMTKLFGPGSYQFFLRGQIGSGGGGSVETGGGIATALSGGIRLMERLELSYAYWDAWQTEMQAPLLEVSYRIPFETNFGFVASNFSTEAGKNKLVPVALPLIIGSRWNLKEGLDRNGLAYQPMGSIFLGTKYEAFQGFWFSGETLWAATGGYGAYAEGMFGVYHDVWASKLSLVGWNASLVAAGGGGIETNKGLALAAGFHYSLKTASKNRWTILARKKYFGVDAYNPWVLGVQYEPTFTILTR